MNTTFADHFFQSHTCTVLDIGARGGFSQLPVLQKFMEVHAVEPEPGAADELRKNHGSNFRKFSVHELALGGNEGEQTLYRTRNGSMSSLLEPDTGEFVRSFGEIKNAPRWMEAMDVISKLNVKTKTLSQFCTENIKGFVDFLKIDTQGNELDILQSGMELLKEGRVGVIATEVAFFPVYKNQAYFSDIDQFLRSCGFRFIECRSYPDVMERENEFSPGKKIYERPRMAPVGDAWYVFDWNTSDGKTADQRTSSAMILGAEGYFSEAAHLLKGILNEEERNTLFRALTRVSSRSRIKAMLKRWTPPAILQWRARMK